MELDVVVDRAMRKWSIQEWSRVMILTRLRPDQVPVDDDDWWAHSLGEVRAATFIRVGIEKVNV